jgi:hypothetical protein
MVAKEEMFRSATRGDFAGVFEFDGESGWFYLFDNGRAAGRKIIGTIHILSGTPDFAGTEVDVRWNHEGLRVGLFIREQLWAEFDAVRGVGSGGHYELGGTPKLLGWSS